MVQDRPAARGEQQGVVFFTEQAQANPVRTTGAKPRKPQASEFRRSPWTCSAPKSEPERRQKAR